MANVITKKDVSKQASQIESLYKDACLIIDKSKQAAYSAVNETLIKRNWLSAYVFSMKYFKINALSMASK